MEKDPESGRSGRISHFTRVRHQGVLNDDILNHPYKGSGTKDDPFLVTWIENDPINPMNYPVALKWSITMLVAVATLAVAFVSSAYSGGIAEILREFQIAQIIGTLGISLFVLGFAIGPLLWAPLSGEYFMFLKRELSPLTCNRAVRTPVPLLRHLHAAHYLQRWCSRFQEHPDSDRPEVFCWRVWLVAIDQRWRSHRRHVPGVSQRSRYKSLRRCSVSGACHRPNR